MAGFIVADLLSEIKQLQTEVNEAWQVLDLDKAILEQEKLNKISQQPDFWNNNEKAQQTMKEISSLQQRINPWQGLKKSLLEIAELAKLNTQDDQALIKELETNLEELKRSYLLLKKELAFSGVYDSHDVILSIYAGAGGTDAQDWAQMLLRMYSRWVESSGGEITLLDQSSGDEAGIKSVTLSITGVPYVYGKLKGEHGVHRLVRLSPFNSDNLRQTSFAKVDVIPQISQPEQIIIDDKDLRVDVYRSGGHGGQSVNTTDSAVRVTHLPTNITVSIQNERSQIQNKETALTILRSKLAQLSLEQHQDKISDLKGPAQAVEWGSQIRNYVLHPYKQVKDLRTNYETSDPEKVLDGNLDELISAYLDKNMGTKA